MNCNEDCKLFADVYDVIVLPDSKHMNSVPTKTERSIINRELGRMEVFAEVAKNQKDVLKKIEEIKSAYDQINWL